LGGKMDFLRAMKRQKVYFGLIAGVMPINGLLLKKSA
jgi:hypothetical protein